MIYAEGTPTESFRPGHVAMAGFEDHVKEQIFEIYPRLRDDPVGGLGPLARPVVGRRETEDLVKKLEAWRKVSGGAGAGGPGLIGRYMRTTTERWRFAEKPARHSHPVDDATSLGGWDCADGDGSDEMTSLSDAWTGPMSLEPRNAARPEAGLRSRSLSNPTVTRGKSGYGELTDAAH